MVLAAEAALLRGHGHEVREFLKDNKEIQNGGRLGLLRDTIWSSRSYAELAALIGSFHPDLVHFHNTLPLVSPAAIHAAKSRGLPTVQTLHNYRLACPNGLMFRSGRVCEDCLGRSVAWPGVLHACYRHSRVASAAVTAMLATHKFMGTWRDKIDMHIALTEFVRGKYVESGIPAERIAVKPNFLADDPGPGNGRGGFALFVGRLTPEKGVETLLAAWPRIPGAVPLKIVGDGPLSGVVADAAGRVPGVSWLGERRHEEVLALMGEATFLLVPSLWYEPFGLTIIEAFARGTPVIGADIGSIGTLIRHGRTGLLHRPADAEDLAEKITWFLSNPDTVAPMRRAARQAFEENYNAPRNYERLMEIYALAIDRNARRG